MEEEAKPLEGGRAAHDLGGQSGEGGGGVVREGKRRWVRRENKGSRYWLLVRKNKLRNFQQELLEWGGGAVVVLSEVSRGMRAGSPKRDVNTAKLFSLLGLGFTNTGQSCSSGVGVG